MSFDLYTSATPNGYKVSIMLEELKLKYKVHKIDLGKQTQKEEWFLNLNPNGRIPVLKDNENNKVIFESGAILYYLAIKYNKFFFEEKRTEIMQWLMFQMSAIGPMQGQANVFFRYMDEKIPVAISRYQNECRRLYEVLDKQLQDNKWICGEYSIADIATWPWIKIYFWAGIDISNLDNLSRWMDQMERRKACKAGILVPKRESSKKVVKNVKNILQT
ncbi:MAG: thiol:disulfide oxidoreductase [Alphaproteobacteria bacterium]|nr:MAG: thiol:disulfide oxidoreductase [Alphaproteobacteria bacterium]